MTNHGYELHAARFLPTNGLDLRSWISRDPLDNAEMSQGPNLYAYVLNNPLRYVDPTGLNYTVINRGHVWVIVDNPNSPSGASAYDFGPDPSQLADLGKGNLWPFRSPGRWRKTDCPDDVPTPRGIDPEYETTPETDAAMIKAFDAKVDAQNENYSLLYNCWVAPWMVINSVPRVPSNYD